MARAGNGHGKFKSLGRSGSTERLEMAHLNGRQTQEQDATYNDEDNESTGEHEDETALLSARRTTGDIKSQSDSGAHESTWAFARGILVEVGHLSLPLGLGQIISCERQLRRYS